MNYSESGRGKTIVLLHGFCEDGWIWRDAQKALAKNYRVLVPHLPGWGTSPWPAGVHAPDMDWYADALHRFLKEQKVKRCLLLGHSMGGYIALHFAEKHGCLLDGFGLVNSHCFADTSEKKANRKKSIAHIRQHGTKHFVRELISGCFHQPAAHKKAIAELTTRAQAASVESVVAAQSAMMNRADKSSVLQQATVPVLFISGKQDPSAPLPYSLQQAALPALSMLHLFDRCGHMSYVEKRAAFLHALQSFAAWVYATKKQAA